ncbi:hypothetical protein [Aeromonas phage phiWae14]|nr:hypothetical protein [Aeromonas phage phiWae14]
MTNQEKMQALVEYIKPRIDSRIAEYVRVRSLKSVGEYTVEIIMVGAKQGCSDVEYFNARWAHFMLHDGDDKFTALCGDCKWKSGVKFPVLRNQKSLELACDKVIAFVNANVEIFKECYGI